LPSLNTTSEPKPQFEEMKEDLIPNNRRNNYQPLSQNEDGQRSHNPGIVEKYFVRPIQWVSSMICNKSSNSGQLQDYCVLTSLPEIVSDINMLTNAIRVKVGLVILYKEKNNPYLDSFVSAVNSEKFIFDILVNLLTLERKLCNFTSTSN
jgi:hypothetical protein